MVKQLALLADCLVRFKRNLKYQTAKTEEDGDTIFALYRLLDSHICQKGLILCLLGKQMDSVV